MKFKRMIILILMLSLIGTATVFANELGRTINLNINGKKVNSSAFSVDNRSMVPIGEVSGSLGLITKWNAFTQTLDIYKPNVHITLYDAKNFKVDSFNRITGSPFGIVYEGSQSFAVHAQIDNLLTEIHSFQITITDPGDKTVYSSPEEKLKGYRESLWYLIRSINIDFAETGKYTVNFLVKPTENSEFIAVSQKTVSVLKQP
jgi:hypothetical protein